MKKVLKTALIIAGAWSAMTTAASAQADCTRSYMTDECSAAGYSVVETEAVVKGPHNCMACAHYFPGEEPEGYCGGYKGKQTVRAVSPVASVGS